MKDYSYLINRKFGRLTILSTYLKEGRTRCKCKCECGKEFETKWNSIQQGGVKSCGCLRIESEYQNGLNNFKHGSSGYLYNLWITIKQKCYSEDHNQYKDYGARGITMFGPWINNFENFETDIVNEIGHKPSKELSLDRTNNDGNYEPGNIQWSTAKEQANNRRAPKSPLLT